MLILTRRENESIVIQAGDTVVYVTLLGVKGNQSRVGVRAPRDVTVDRQEVYERKVRERKAREANTRTADPASTSAPALTNNSSLWHEP